jgi:mono/diheme cytochrome c family protein
MKSLLALAFAFALALPARAEENKTQLLWEAKCQKCHGPDGRGQSNMGKKLHAPDFTRERWQKHNDDDEIKKAIKEGVVEHGKRKMPAFKEKLGDPEIDALVAYVRGFGKPAEAPKAEEPKAEEPKAEEPKAEEPKAEEPPKE